jgi:hypothetical protein
MVYIKTITPSLHFKMDQDILRHLRRWEGTTVYPIILLGGPSGIGKTTQARILSRDLGIPYTSHDLHGNARNFLFHLSAILREHHCAIVDRVFLDGNMAWIEDLKTIMRPYGVMDVALFPIFPVIHDDLVEAALQNMEKRTIALEETAYADEPNRMKCGKTMEDRRKILQKQLEGSQTIKKAAYVEIMDKGVQRSIMDVALAYRGALAGLLHQHSRSGSKKRKNIDASL